MKSIAVEKTRLYNLIKHKNLKGKYMIAKSELRNVINEILEEHDLDSIEAIQEDLVDRMSLEFMDSIYDDEDEENE